MTDWQPAIIASAEHIRKMHPRSLSDEVSKYAGQRIRVRENEAAHEALKRLRHSFLNCQGKGIEVHPEDAARLWPELEGNVSLCTCDILMD